MTDGELIEAMMDAFYGGESNDAREMMRAALSVVREAEGWRPIESAPRDGAPIDLWVPGIGRVTDEWWDGGWGVPGGPTHWLPLPSAPEDAA